jgi:hypothetical protein
VRVSAVPCQYGDMAATATMVELSSPGCQCHRPDHRRPASVVAEYAVVEAPRGAHGPA